MKATSITPYAAILVLQLVAAWGLLFAVDVRVSEELPVVERLPGRVGEWTGEGLWFCVNAACEPVVYLDSELGGAGVCPECGAALSGGSLLEVAQLPPDTRIRKARYEHPSGEVLTASYVLSGKDRASLHRPQVCLTDAGNEIAREQVLTVPLAEGGSLRVSVLDLERRVAGPGGAPVLQPSYYAYWFTGVRHETPYHVERMAWMAADKVFRSTASRWAYVSISGPRTPGSDAHLDQVRAFLAEFHPLVKIQGSG